MKKPIFYTLSIILSFGLLSSCYAGNQPHATVVIPLENHRHTTTVITHIEAPPHAPAHGYRHHYNDHDLQFNSNFGAYLAIGSPGIYFYNDRYLRFYSNGWQISSRISDGWRPAHRRHIPQPLWQHHAQRLHYQGHDMTYDADIGAYYITKQPGIYFYNNRYIRRYGATWQTTNKLNGKWLSAKEQHVPRKLHKKKHRKKQQKKRNKQHKNKTH